MKRGRSGEFSLPPVVAPESIEFCDIPDEQRMLFDLGPTVRAAIEARNSHAVHEKLKHSPYIGKTAIQITPTFAIAVQNVVLTFELTKYVKRSAPELYVFPGQNIEPLEPAPGGLCDPDTGEPLYRIRRPISLQAFARHLRHAGIQYNRPSFAAAIMRERVLNAAILTSSSGRVVFTGCSHVDLCLCLQEDTLKILEKIGVADVAIPTPRLENIVSNGRFPDELCLSLMRVLYTSYFTPMPRFRGNAFVHPELGNRVVLVFRSGHLNHTGARGIEDIVHDMRIIYPILIRCRATPENLKLERYYSEQLDMHTMLPAQPVDDLHRTPPPPPLDVAAPAATTTTDQSPHG